MAKRSAKKWLLGLASAAVIVVVLIVLAPAIIGAMFGATIVRGMVQPLVRGTVTVEKAEFRWRGPQRVTGLAIRDPDGFQVADLSLRTDLRILSLLTGRLESMELVVRGVVRSEVEADGSNTFERVVVRNGRHEPDPKSRPKEPFSVAGLPNIHLRLEAMRLEIIDKANDQTIVVHDIDADGRFRTREPILFTLDARSEAEGHVGDVRVRAEITDLFDASGLFKPSGAIIAAELLASNLPLPAIEGTSRALLEQGRLVIRADDLADRVQFFVFANADLGELEQSIVEVQLAVASLFSPTGTLDFRLERLTGSAHGTNVPSLLLQPIFAATPVNMKRDAGRIANVSVHFEAGDPLRAIIEASAPETGVTFWVEAEGDLESGTWAGRDLALVAPEAHPDLVEGYTGLRIAAPTHVDIRLPSFTLPAVDEAKNRRPLPEYAAEGEIRVRGPVELLIEPENLPVRRLHAEQIVLSFDSPRMRDELHVRGSALVEGGQINLDHRITHLFNDADEIDAFGARPVGTLQLQSLPSHTVLQWIPDEQVAAARELLGPQLTASVITSLRQDDLIALVMLNAGSMNGSLQAAHQREQVALEAAAMEITVSPELARLLQADIEGPILLLDPATFDVRLEPLTIALSDPFDWQMPTEAMRGRVRSPLVRLEQVPGASAAIALQNLDSTIAVTFTDMTTFDLQTGLVVREDDGNRRIARTQSVVQAMLDDESIRYGGHAELTDIRMPVLERVLGIERRVLTEWTGDDGQLVVEFTGRGNTISGTVQSNLARIVGDLQFSIDEEMFEASAEELNITAASSKLESILNREGAAAQLQIAADVPVTLRLERARLPRAAIAGEPMNPDLVRIRGTLTGGPVRLSTNGAAASTLRNLRATVDSESLRQGVQFELTGRSLAAGQEPGDINVRGTIRNLIDAENHLNLASAQLDLDATATHAPTMLVDALLGLGGYLTAAVGTEIDATVLASQFSPDSGAISLDLRTPHGFLRGEGTAADGLLRISADNPVQAQLDLNPLMRQRLLPSLHPLLGDVMALTRPFEAQLGNATLPLRGGVERLNADLALNIGEVTFDRRSSVFEILALAQVAGPRQIVGQVEPIRAQIQNGSLHYDTFNVRVGDTVLPQQGSINLKTGQLGLRTSASLDSLAVGVLPRPATEALTGRFGRTVGQLEVPIVIAGTIDSPRPRIDPAFKLEEQVARLLAEAMMTEFLPEGRRLPLPIPIPNGGRFDGLFPRDRDR